MNFFTKGPVLFLVFACSLFQSIVNAQSVLDPNDPIVIYPNAPEDPRPLPPPPALPLNPNVISKWLRGNVRVMTGAVATAPLGYTWNSDAYKAYIYKNQTF